MHAHQTLEFFVIALSHTGHDLSIAKLREIQWIGIHGTHLITKCMSWNALVFSILSFYLIETRDRATATAPNHYLVVYFMFTLYQIALAFRSIFGPHVF